MTIFRKNYKNPRKSEFPNFSYNLLRLHVCNLYLLVQTFNCTFHSLCWSHMTVNYGCSNKTLAFQTETSLDWLIFCCVSCNFRIWIFHSDIVIIIVSGYLRCGTFCLTQIFFVSSLSIFDFYQSTQFLVQNIDIHVDITSKFTASRKRKSIITRENSKIIILTIWSQVLLLFIWILIVHMSFFLDSVYSS